VDSGPPVPESTSARQAIVSSSIATASITSKTGSTRKLKAASAVVSTWISAMLSVSTTM
jgi:hypothetical protein